MKRSVFSYLACATIMLAGLTSLQAQQSGDIAKLFPDNTEMAFSFNVKSLLSSSLFQKHFKEDLEKRIKENSQLQGVMQSLGFDPMRDITSVTFTVSKFNAKIGGPPEADGFMIAKGAFNVEKMNGALGALIAAANQSDRVTTTKYGDFLMYEVKDKDSGKNFYATIYDKETIIGGTVKEDVTNAIERLIGRKSSSLNSKFSELLAKARNDNTVWGAIMIPASVREMSKMAPNPELGDAISKLETQTMNLNIKDNVKFDVSMHMSEEGAASQMKTLMDQAKDMAGALALSNEQFGSELADLVSSLQIGSNGKKVSLAGDIKADLADKLIKAIKSR